MILERLIQPTRIPDVIKHFAEVGLDVSKEIESLEARGLVFREGDRLLSLVLKELPSKYSRERELAMRGDRL